MQLDPSRRSCRFMCFDLLDKEPEFTKAAAAGESLDEVRTSKPRRPNLIAEYT